MDVHHTSWMHTCGGSGGDVGKGALRATLPESPAAQGILYSDAGKRHELLPCLLLDCWLLNDVR